jgi:RimJ/RimL family protein N-acetyltransferase
MAQNLIVLDQSQVFVDYINKELDVNFSMDDTRTVSHVRKNDDGTHTILAVILFSRWCVHHVEASIASSSPRWATWNYLHAAYEYIFSTGRSRINFLAEVTNTDAITMHEKLGHVKEGHLRDLFGEDRDAYIFGMTRRDYLNSKWRTKKTRS